MEENSEGNSLPKDISTLVSRSANYSWSKAANTFSLGNEKVYFINALLQSKKGRHS